MMFERRLKILLVVFLSLGCNIVIAQQISTGDKSGVINVDEEYTIFRFPPGNQGFFAAYGDNVTRLNELSRIIDNNIDDIHAGRLVVRVNGYCTSMPSVSENLRMAKTRSNHVKSWFILYNNLKEEHFKTYNAAKNWNNQKDVVAVAYLEIVSEKDRPVPPVPIKEEPKTDLPDTVIAEEVVVEQPEPVVEYPAEILPEKEVQVPLETHASYLFTPKLAVKTNLLYWAGVMPDFKHYSFVPNLELEWFFNSRWSLAATGAYRKWDASSDKFFGVSSWSLEPRFWLQDKDNTGFFVGLYGQFGDFDNQKLHINEFGRTGDFYGAGISLGAYIPFTQRLGMEIGIRGGYRNTETDIYSYEEPNYYLDYSETRNKWAITGIKVSMVYRFGTKIW